ncbi:hypothetical protein ACFWBN_37470 [Streptomyces sp. NPDC059989]|uniref:hypothetical protein n=1 Tax=Streptomyces sp. NPDC059989 TaxID=3347026 RepID=UPI0036CC3051
MRLTNRTNLNLKDVELRLHIPGEVDAYRTVSYASNESVTGLPTRPSPFGSARRKSTFQQAVTANMGMIISPNLSDFPGARSLYAPDPSLPNIVNGGSATITYKLGDIRPQGHADARGVIILASAPAGPLITATWAATSTNHDTVVTGTLDLTVSDRALRPNDLITSSGQG